MTCASVRHLATLYLYGELVPEQEEQLEAHVDGCPACAGEIEAARALGRVLDTRSLDVSPSLLVECRQSLSEEIQHVDGPAGGWATMRGTLHSFMNPVIGLRHLAAAAALVVLGFMAARVTTKTSLAPDITSSTGGVPASLAPSPDAVVSGIRSVQPGPSGAVRISLDETLSRVVTGKPSDASIQDYLLAAAEDVTNPGLRVDSIEILKDHSGSLRVRSALVRALMTDPNPGVRLKALEGLERLSTEVEIRRAMTRALVFDDNPGVRIRVIDLLTKDHDADLVGVLQTQVQNERNNYVRLRCQDALRQMNASAGAF